MKKLFAITVLMSLAMSGFAQQIHYDFAETIESGQTLFFLKSNDNPFEAQVTYPCYYWEQSSSLPDYYHGYEKPSGNLIVPATITHNGIVYTITRIDDNAFAQCIDLLSVALSNSLFSIGDGAFYSCISLITVDFGNALQTIGRSAFSGCTSLEQISAFPETLTTMYDDAFANDRNLSGRIVIPPHLTTIRERAFYGCNITSVVFSEGVTTIGRYAFSACPIDSLYISSTVTSIYPEGYHDGSFFYCGDLRSIIVNEANPIYDSRGNCNALIETATNTLIKGGVNTIIPDDINIIGPNAFSSIIELDSIVIPFSVERLEAEAFYGCNSLSTITLPSMILYIGNGALSCSGLTSIICKSPCPPTAFNEQWDGGYLNSFIGVNSDIPIYIPFGTTETYHNAPGWDYFTNFIETEINTNEGEWYYEILNSDGSITYQHLVCTGDTVVQGKRPKVIVRSNTHYDRDGQTEVTHEYIFEENNIVYWWNKDLEEFTVLYDLGAQPGDSWVIKVGTESITMHVDALENIEYEGNTYRMLRVSDENDFFSGNIVYGIGHLTSFFPEQLMTRRKGYRVEGLRCFWVGDELVFKIGDVDCDAIYTEWHNDIEEGGPSTGSGTFTIYPNPTNNVLFVQTLHATSLPAKNEYRITNLTGQTLLQGTITAENQQIDIEKLPKGMYFITSEDETQKFIVK